ncbi:MAG: AMIN-like domain-containing (lipo)protein [Acidimicrobiia bacterium]
MRRGAFVLVIALAAVAAACGDDNNGSGSPSSTTTESTTASSSGPPSSGSGSCSFDGGTASVELAGQAEVMVLSDVRVAGHPCFDRVVFEFRDPGDPGFQVGYVPGPIVMDGSGDPVDVQGSTFLQIRMPSASGFDFETSTPSYTGPTEFTPSDTAQIREVVRTGDFEALLTWVVGLDEVRPFEVSVLHDPTRVVVDVG